MMDFRTKGIKPCAEHIFYQRTSSFHLTNPLLTPYTMFKLLQLAALVAAVAQLAVASPIANATTRAAANTGQGEHTHSYRLSQSI